MASLQGFREGIGPTGRGILRNVGRYAGPVGTAIGSIWGPPGMAIGGALSGLVGSGLESLAGEEQVPESPLQLAQQRYLQQIQQPAQQLDIGGLQQLLRQQYMQEIVPELANRFAGMGGLRSSGFREALQAGAGNIGSQLGRIAPQLFQQQQQNELSRMGQFGNYLTGQQQLGQQQQLAAAQAQQAGAQGLMNLINAFTQYSRGGEQVNQQTVEALRRALESAKQQPAETADVVIQ